MSKQKKPRHAGRSHTHGKSGGLEEFFRAEEYHLENPGFHPGAGFSDRLVMEIAELEDEET